MDISYHSYFSVMEDLLLQGPSSGKYYEIRLTFVAVLIFGNFSFYVFLFVLLKDSCGTVMHRLLYLPGAVIAGVLGFLVDFPVISFIAICKSPYMLFKGWHRLFQDCIGREGPFLETICVPFAGLAILLWPLAVAGAVLASILSSIFLGPYAAVVVYQVSNEKIFIYTVFNYT